MRETNTDYPPQVVSIEVQRDHLKAQEVLQLIHRCMLAAGYEPDSINKYLPLGKLYEPVSDSMRP